MTAEIIIALIAGACAGLTSAVIVVWMVLHVIVAILEEKNERK
ncbi:hypothetical protein [Corynebacterium propinquum]|nr:hypothetical protein [Corynebacterium propinquum]MDK4252609.1 hypothetical protein [Corynebacterium propinquum]